ncbi:hypothetical protein TELCIR_14568 [Teladorsagia circumcincta]|uniref:Uncharacterized protein n=1 Tax=Teladorsagia circumcincta TaxID=45464 RepID=A0A2G9U2T4_TELCI|nr:hypothetical protein TELCIR_14568 [Teladorsagia circumcincta]
MTILVASLFHADLIAHDGAPYADLNGVDCFKPFKELDRFLPTQRTENISTTNLIQRVLDQCELFHERNRKRSKRDRYG